METLEISILSDRVVKKIMITDGITSVVCEVEHIENDRYIVVTNTAEVLELTGNSTTIKILEYE